jgi:6-phosphogluconolactonase
VPDQNPNLFLGATICNSADEVFAKVAVDLTNHVNQLIALNGSCHIVLSGGQSITNIISLIDTAQIRWESVTISLADERCVPVGDAKRNDLVIQRALISRIPTGGPKFLNIPAELGPIEAANEFEAVLSRQSPVDIALLGVGEDGHIASLFTTLNFNTNTRRVVPVFDSPKAPQHRVSLSFNELCNVPRRIIPLTGHNKRGLFVQLCKGIPLPVTLFMPTDWYLDTDATDGRHDI